MGNEKMENIYICMYGRWITVYNCILSSAQKYIIKRKVIEFFNQNLIRKKRLWKK